MNDKFSNSLFIALIFGFFFADRVEAYIDPGTGSYFFQMLLAVIFGGLFAIKTFWKKIVSYFFKNKASEVDSIDDLQSDNTDVPIKK
jgi:hypothetical protein